MNPTRSSKKLVSKPEREPPHQTPKQTLTWCESQELRTAFIIRNYRAALVAALGPVFTLSGIIP